MLRCAMQYAAVHDAVPGAAHARVPALLTLILTLLTLTLTLLALTHPHPA